MGEQELEHIERQILAAGPGAPAGLRAAVLDATRQELRAGTWDRRLARSAAAILAVGVGLNAATGWWGVRNVGAFAGSDGAGPRNRIAQDAAAQDALVRTAAAVADVTDAETGRRVARQMAALGGRELSDEQAAAIDAALRKHEG